MFNVGAGELLVIFLIALVVLGPDKLPDAARKMGTFMGEVRRMSTGFQNEMKNAINYDELKRDVMGSGAGPSLPPLESEVRAVNDATTEDAPKPHAVPDPKPAAGESPAA